MAQFARAGAARGVAAGLGNLTQLLIGRRERETEEQRRKEEAEYRQSILGLNQQQQQLAEERHLREQGGGLGAGPQEFVSRGPVVLPEPEARPRSIQDIGRSVEAQPLGEAPIVRLPEPGTIPEPVPAPGGRDVTRLGPDYEMALEGRGYVERPEVRERKAEERAARERAAIRGEQPWQPMTWEERKAEIEVMREGVGGRYPPALTAIEREIDDARMKLSALTTLFSRTPEGDPSEEGLRGQIAAAIGRVDGLEHRHQTLSDQLLPTGRGAGTPTPVPPPKTTTPPPVLTEVPDTTARAPSVVAPVSAPTPPPVAAPSTLSGRTPEQERFLMDTMRRRQQATGESIAEQHGRASAPVAPAAPSAPAAAAPAPSAAAPSVPAGITVTIDSTRREEARLRAQQLQAEGKSEEEIARILNAEFSPPAGMRP